MLTLYHDYTSPASAVAVLRLQRLADTGVAIGFLGFDVLGLDRPIPVTLPVLEELDRQRDAAAALGLRLRRPGRCPPTVGAHLVGEVAESRGLGASWRETAYRAFWERGVDLGDSGALTGLAVAAGLERAPTAAVLADRQRRLALRRRMMELRGRGVGGVPVLEAQSTFVSPFLPEDDLRHLAGLA